MEKNASKLTGIALATTVAGLFALGATMPAQAQPETSGTEVNCANSSSCKGQGACATANNACHGQNACKGQGMTTQPDEAACKAAQEKAKGGGHDQHDKK